MPSFQRPACPSAPVRGGTAGASTSSPGYRLSEHAASADSGATALLTRAMADLHAEMREQRQEMRQQGEALAAIVAEMAASRGDESKHGLIPETNLTA